MACKIKLMSIKCENIPKPNKETIKQGDYFIRPYDSPSIIGKVEEDGFYCYARSDWGNYRSFNNDKSDGLFLRKGDSELEIVAATSFMLRDLKDLDERLEKLKKDNFRFPEADPNAPYNH